MKALKRQLLKDKRKRHRVSGRRVFKLLEFLGLREERRLSTGRK